MIVSKTREEEKNDKADEQKTQSHSNKMMQWM